MPDTSISLLTELVTPFRNRARCPYSEKPDAAAVLLSDGTWVPGVRIETASFSLAIGALLNAVTTAVAAGRTDIVAAVLLDPATESQTAYLEELPFTSLRLRDHLTFVSSEAGHAPAPGNMLDPFCDSDGTDSSDGISATRHVARRAFAPLSLFPVGCIMELRDGRRLPGVNVEHPDWNHILCAERNALGTAVTYGLDHLITSAYLSCLRDPNGTPCGACRQVISELAPNSTIVMDRGDLDPESSTPSSLLPGYFTGSAILSRHDVRK